MVDSLETTAGGRRLPPRTRLAARVGGAVGALSRRLGRGTGSVIGGRAILAIDPEALAQLSRGRDVALVSGTNGKTTTTSLLSAALSLRGPVVSNALGANLPPGLTAALADAPADLRQAVLEVDEAWLRQVVEATDPSVVVLLNLSRDQLDRNNEVRRLSTSWRDLIALRTVQGRAPHVVANADDPLVAWAAQAAESVTWVGAGQRWTADASGCPNCGGRIQFPNEAPPAPPPLALPGPPGAAEPPASPSPAAESAAALPFPAAESAAALPFPAAESAAALPFPAAESAAALPFPAAESAAALPFPAAESAAALPFPAAESAAALPFPPAESAAALPVPPAELAPAPEADAGTPPESWACSQCQFRRPDLDVWLDGDDVVFRDGQRVAMRLQLPGRCNQANAAMAISAAARFGLDRQDAAAAMAATTEVAGRYRRVTVGTVSARMLLAKNPAGWLEVFDLLSPPPTPVVIAINAQIADGKDPSWLWDVPFERLRGRLVVATGERSADLAVRLHYADVDHRRQPDLLLAIGEAGARDVDVVANYTSFQAINRRLAHAG